MRVRANRGSQPAATIFGGNSVSQNPVNPLYWLHHAVSEAMQLFACAQAIWPAVVVAIEGVRAERGPGCVAGGVGRSLASENPVNPLHSLHCATPPAARILRILVCSQGQASAATRVHAR